MAPFDDLPIPRVDPVTRVASVLRSQRVGAIRLPPGVVPPAGQRLLAAWQRYREHREGGEGPEEEPAGPGTEPVPDGAPPETYGEHGELLHPHEAVAPERPHLDLEG